MGFTPTLMETAQKSIPLVLVPMNVYSLVPTWVARCPHVKIFAGNPHLLSVLASFENPFESEGLRFVSGKSRGLKRSASGTAKAGQVRSLSSVEG